MRQFKKRTLALVLASVITVAGSFASERYKNTLKALTFENKGNGIINMVVQTGSAYSGNVTPIKRGADKYVLMLPEVDANSVQSDFRNVSSDIIGVETNTLPYTTNSNGYTKIVVYTKANVNLVGENRIFIPSADEKKLISNNNHSERKVEQPQRYKQPQETNESVSEPVEEDYQEETQEEYSEQPLVEDNISQEESIQDSASQVYEEPNKNDPYESYILFLSAFLILLLCIFIYKHSLSKMQEIAGESIDFSEDSENKKKEKKSKQIRSTIKNLDSKYSRPTGMPKTSEYTVSESKPVVEEIPEIANVVDLDEIFKETKKAKEEVKHRESIREKSEVTKHTPKRKKENKEKTR